MSEASLTCPACGTHNRPDRRFCRDCGTSLASGCPACGASNDPEDRYCGSCGASITEPATSGTPARPDHTTGPRTVATVPTPVAELRLVTVLFADLVGFTTLAEGHDAEQTRELLGRYFGIARDVVERYGGTIEKFIGDAVMAVWGAPIARENDAERAVRAGLDLLTAIPQLGEGISARAGLVTGEAAVTIGAVGQGMVAGDLVNTASRLQAAAAPGTVLVGEATMHAAAAAVAFVPAGEQVLRGKATPVPAWVAQRVVAEVGGRNRSEGLEAPFVGRDGELQMLKDQFHATSRDGRPRLVRWSDPPASARAGWPGSSTSTWTASWRRSGGTPADRRHTARASRCGHWARWSGRAAGCSRPTMSGPPGRRWPARSHGSCPRRPAGAGSNRPCWRSWALTGEPPAPSSCSRRGARSSSAWRPPARW